jgi:putative hydrolase of the HAD superfamily
MVRTKPFTTLLFDMDNTLFDLVEAQMISCHAVSRYLGKCDGDSLFEYFLRPIRGFESHENILDYMSDHDLPVDDRYSSARRIYESEKLRNIEAYDGVADTLAFLRDQGYRMGIVTDAHSRDATLRLEKTRLLPFFDGMVTSDMVQVKKPRPEPFLFALEMMQAGNDEVILVGDSPHRDIAPCRELGIKSVYARYGDRFASTRDSVATDYVIDRMTELPGIIERVSREIT